MNIHKIIVPTPYAVGDVNAFLLKGDALTLVDAGVKTPEALAAIEIGIKEAGYTLNDIDQLLLTHHHPDHAGWVDTFKGKQIIGHSYIDNWLRQEEAFLSYRMDFYESELIKQGVEEPFFAKILEYRGDLTMIGNTPLTTFIEHEQEVPGHPGLKAYYTPGHAQSHMIYHDELTHEVIGGDLLLEKISSNPLVEPPVDLSGERPKSLIQYNQSLQFIHDLNPAKVYTGHGEEVTNVQELVQQRLLRQKTRAMKVYEMLSTPKTVFEVTKELFPKVYMKEPGLTVSETLGQLDYLEHEQLINAHLEDGVYYYEKK